MELSYRITLTLKEGDNFREINNKVIDKMGKMFLKNNLQFEIETLTQSPHSLKTYYQILEERGEDYVE